MCLLPNGRCRAYNIYSLRYGSAQHMYVVAVVVVRRRVQNQTSITVQIYRRYEAYTQHFLYIWRAVYLVLWVVRIASFTASRAGRLKCWLKTKSNKASVRVECRSVYATWVKCLFLVFIFNVFSLLLLRLASVALFVATKYPASICKNKAPTSKCRSVIAQHTHTHTRTQISKLNRRHCLPVCLHTEISFGFFPVCKYFAFPLFVRARTIPLASFCCVCAPPVCIGCVCVCAFVRLARIANNSLKSFALRLRL